MLSLPSLGYLISPEVRLLQKSGRASAFEAREGKPQISVRYGQGGNDFEKEAKSKPQKIVLSHWAQKKSRRQEFLLMSRPGNWVGPTLPDREVIGATAPGILAECEN